MRVEHPEKKERNGLIVAIGANVIVAQPRLCLKRRRRGVIKKCRIFMAIHGDYG